MTETKTRKYYEITFEASHHLQPRSRITFHDSIRHKDDVHAIEDTLQKSVDKIIKLLDAFHGSQNYMYCVCILYMFAYYVCKLCEKNSQILCITGNI